MISRNDPFKREGDSGGGTERRTTENCGEKRKVERERVSERQREKKK